jgi:hypothetical protein
MLNIRMPLRNYVMLFQLGIGPSLYQGKHVINFQQTKQLAN